MENLTKVNPEDLTPAVERTIAEWNESSKMPTLKFILDRVAPYVPVGRKFKTVADIDPSKCPSGWTPEDVFRAQLTQEKIRGTARRPMDHDDDYGPVDLKAVGAKAGFSPEEIQEMLQAGKKKQQDHIAKLEADQEWRKMAKNLGAKLKGDS